MLDALAAPGMGPFTVALFALIGLLVLEAGLMVVGLSTHLDLGDAALPGGEAGLAQIPHLPDAALAEIDPGDPDIAHGVAPGTPGAGAAILRGLGLGDAPATVWLASLAFGFAVAGFVLQGLAGAIFGGPLPAGAAAAIAAPPALAAARSLSRLVGRLVPPVETYATRSFHRRLGRVTVGVARHGYPAEVSYGDSFGNTHQLMAEPLDPGEEIPAGSEVLILRDRHGKPRLVRLS